MYHKGDCIILTRGTEKFGLILHHILSDEEKTYFGFIIVGEIFKKMPTREKIESCGVLGYKYQNDTADLLNSSMRNQQNHDKSVFYTGIKYDVISIPDVFFAKENSGIEKVVELSLHPEFYPLPNFRTNQFDFNEICDLIKNRILKREPNTVNWSTIYDSYPVKEILIG